MPCAIRSSLRSSPRVSCMSHIIAPRAARCQVGKSKKCATHVGWRYRVPVVLKQRTERAQWQKDNREGRGWSDAELAHRLDVAGYKGARGPTLSPNTVRGWEAPGRNGPPEGAIPFLEGIFRSTAPLDAAGGSHDDTPLAAALEHLASAIEHLPVRMALMLRATDDLPLDALPEMLGTDVAQILEMALQRSSLPSPVQRQGSGS